MNNIRQLLIMICLCLAAATHSQAKSSAEKACITGTVCTINNAPFANVPVCLEVITSKLAENGSVRAMTDSLGRFSINWKDLSRKKSLQPAYTLYINYLRDYMRIDANECLAYPCVTKKGKGAAGDFFIDPDGTVDLKARRIRVNVISPGTIDTGVFVGVPKEIKDQFVSQIPMGRIGRSEEIAKAALFLASDDSSFVTGIELFVDGGTAQI